MKQTLLSKLRNQHTSRGEFRQTTEQLSSILASEAGDFLTKQRIEIETPLAKTTGTEFTKELVIIPILRAGLAMLPAFLRFYPHASVGFFGMRRDEVSKKPHLYYQNLPKITKKTNVILIDPMIATGGSGILALEAIPVPQEQIVYVGIIAAPEGVGNVKSKFPNIHLITGTVDDHLNQDAFIVPGIGDFGDRYFGTE